MITEISFQELISERDAGFAKLNQAIEAGEKLYPNTATEGREKVRQELRQMKLAWESLFDDLSSAQRKLEVALVQWTTFDDSYGQVEQWLRDAEMQLEGQVPLRSTLEEKKTQLQNFKVIPQWGERGSGSQRIGGSQRVGGKAVAGGWGDVVGGTGATEVHLRGEENTATEL